LAHQFCPPLVAGDKVRLIRDWSRQVTQISRRDGTEIVIAHAGESGVVVMDDAKPHIDGIMFALVDIGGKSPRRIMVDTGDVVRED